MATKKTTTKKPPAKKAGALARSKSNSRKQPAIQSRPTAYIVFKFEDQNDMRVPWVDVRSKELMDYARMFCDQGSPELRASGRAALEAVAQELHDLKMEIHLERLRGASLSTQKSEAGKIGAAARWGDPSTRIGDEIVAVLAAYRDQLGDPLGAKDLWADFFAELDKRGLHPQELGPTETDDSSLIRWSKNGTDGGEPEMKFKTFRNKLSIARGSEK